jgi:hypothetical protein
MRFEILTKVCPHWYAVKMEAAEFSEMSVTSTLHILTIDILVECRSFFKILNNIYILILIWRANYILGEAHLLLLFMYIFINSFCSCFCFPCQHEKKSKGDINRTVNRQQVAPSDLNLRGVSFKSQPERKLFWQVFFMVFQPLQVNTRTVSRSRTLPLPSTSFPIHHLLIVPPFNSLQPELLLTALLIKA